MKKILLLSNGKAYLPEIEAYKEYITDYKLVDSRELDYINFKEFDLVWKFMGTDFYDKYDVPLIHEYASLSTGKFAKLKNKIKKIYNVKPALRIFLNKNVKDSLGFSDNTPYVYRDMGINEKFFIKNYKKNYDFVYVGTISQDRQIESLLKKFSRDLKVYTLLLIGEPDKLLYESYKKYPNIIFAGRLKYHELPQLASQAEYAINYIPNKYPYNLQTSTKLLEYIAMDLKIITTNYQWVNEFEKERKMNFYKVKEDLENLNMIDLLNFNFKNNNVLDLNWKNIIEKSNLNNFIKKLISLG